MMSSIIREVEIKNKAVCPIPLHKKKLMERGYNQVELIASELNKDYGCKIVNLIKRTKNTKPQYNLTKSQRNENIKSAFKFISNNKNIKSIILLDDLTTTGSTFREATKVVKQNGIENVICLAFAKGNFNNK